jgi:MFS family permease
MLLIQKTAWIVPCWCVVTVGMAFIDGSANPELADIGEQRHPGSYGKIYAISTTGTGIGFVIGPLIGAALLEHGFQVTWICFGAALVAASVFVSLGFVSFISSGKYAYWKRYTIRRRILLYQNFQKLWKIMKMSIRESRWKNKRQIHLLNRNCFPSHVGLKSCISTLASYDFGETLLHIKDFHVLLKLFKYLDNLLPLLLINRLYRKPR